MRARVLLVTVGAVVLAEAIVLALIPSSTRLRRFVDVVAAEGLALAVVGAFLSADRPFLAARTLARRVPPRDPMLRNDVPPRSAPDKKIGYLTFGLGAALFGLAAILWALRGILPH